MGQLYNIYCDESCHLVNDAANSTAMVIVLMIKRRLFSIGLEKLRQNMVLL